MNALEIYVFALPFIVLAGGAAHGMTEVDLGRWVPSSFNGRV